MHYARNTTTYDLADQPVARSAPGHIGVETLEPRRLMATTLAVPVPPALDGEARMEEVVDFPDGFGALWSLDLTDVAFDAGGVTGSIFHDSRGVMEFPLSGVPAGSRIDSAVLRFDVLASFSLPDEGSPEVEFRGEAGDGRIELEEFSQPQGPPPADPFAAVIGGTAVLNLGVHSVPLDTRILQSLVGRASHFRVTAGDGNGSVTIRSAEGAARSDGTAPTLVLTFTPPAQPVPAPPPLPSGTVAGHVFIDTDADGAKDAGEAPAARFGVFIDADRDGLWDGDEYVAHTDAAGNYRFRGLTAGTYRVRPIVPGNLGNWRQTAPAGRFFDVTLATNQGNAAAPGAFGLRSPTVQIYGTAFEDRDGDGARDAGEPGLAHRQVYLDQNNNGSFDVDDRTGIVIEEPNTFTDAYGNYFFYNQPAGTHRVREVRQAGMRQTTPGGVHAVALAPGQVATGKNLGSVRDDTVPPPPPPPPPPPGPIPNTISGHVFEDSDADGVRDAGERPLEGVKVYIDGNRNGVWDQAQDLGGTDEYSIDTDENGEYILSGVLGLAPGTYRVRQVLQAGLRQTAPVAGFYDVTLAQGRAVTGRDFGNARAIAPPPGGGITLQAESARRSGAVTTALYPGYTGSGFVDFRNPSGDFIEFTAAAAPGPYGLEFRYCNGSAAARTMDVLVNGTKAGRVTFAPTGSWTSWKTVTFAPAQLAKAAPASNTIRLVATGQSGPNLDSLTLRPLAVTTHQAESATRGGAAIVSTAHGGFTGSGFLDFRNPAGDFAEFNVNAAASGSYTLTFRHANGSGAARTMGLSVNGINRPGGITFGATGSWTAWREVRVFVQLTAGANRIRLTATGQSGPNLDSLTVVG